ncbi:MAG: hypothetical protein ACOYIT_04035 [Christensenellales bacterium]|jgi:hypothetical protein
MSIIVKSLERCLLGVEKLYIHHIFSLRAKLPSEKTHGKVYKDIFSTALENALHIP